MRLQKNLLSISKEKYAIRCTIVRPWEFEWEVTLVKNGNKIPFTVEEDAEDENV